VVWTAPVSEVAERLGVSDVALPKLCRGAAIPIPYRGYWAKMNAGYLMARTPLPPSPPGLPERGNDDAGSTGGGIKMIRTMIIGRQAATQMKQLMHPRAPTATENWRSADVGQSVCGSARFHVPAFHLHRDIDVRADAIGFGFHHCIQRDHRLHDNMGPGLGASDRRSRIRPPQPSLHREIPHPENPPLRMPVTVAPRVTNRA
jgi:hypothetical protein